MLSHKKYGSLPEKLDDEFARLINNGGRVIDQECFRVDGILSMTKAKGDHDLKNPLTSKITFNTTSEDHEFLILQMAAYRMSSALRMLLGWLVWTEGSVYCAHTLHQMVLEEYGSLQYAITMAFAKANDRFCDKTLAPSSCGSTVVTIILSPCQIIAANCGDSRDILGFHLTANQKVRPVNLHLSIFEMVSFVIMVTYCN